MSIIKELILSLTLLTSLALSCYAQTPYRGMVVDSASVSVLTEVHIKIKNSARGTITNDQGIFLIQAQPIDTLIISRVGYVHQELPLLFEETVLFIRLREQTRMLKEITIEATRLQPSTITRSPRKLPTPLSRSAAFFSPIDYFSRWQREKRKLLKYIQENERTFVYLQVVSDQETRELFMEEFSLSEDQYYERLAAFNQQSGELQYSTNAEKIKESLKTFLSKATR